MGKTVEHIKAESLLVSFPKSIRFWEVEVVAHKAEITRLKEVLEADAKRETELCENHAAAMDEQQELAIDRYEDLLIHHNISEENSSRKIQSLHEMLCKVEDELNKARRMISGVTEALQPLGPKALLRECKPAIKQALVCLMGETADDSAEVWGAESVEEE